MKFSYMRKAETKIYKAEFNELFAQIKEHFIDTFSLSYRLVGSSKRNLVIKDPNEGFDLDYQILIQKEKINKKPKEIKEDFFDFIKSKKKNYTIQNSTSAITIKQIENNKILYSFDVVIIKETKDSAKILRRDEQNNYSFEQLKQYKNFKENLKTIKGSNQWQEVRNKYLIKRSYYWKQEDKKSYQILIEVVNEITSKK